jgi:hypothetical protein
VALDFRAINLRTARWIARVANGIGKICRVPNCGAVVEHLRAVRLALHRLNGTGGLRFHPVVSLHIPS